MPALVSTDISSDLKKRARCPRCGYDLHGTIDTWTDACPLTGVCSECGLEFIWSEVLCPEKYEPLWCVEFPIAGSLPRSAWKTYLMSFRPWRFWRELKMANAVRWRRLMVYVLLLVIPLLAIYVIEQSAVAIQVWRLRQQRLLVVQKQTQAFIVRFQQNIDEMKTVQATIAQQIASSQDKLNDMKSADEIRGRSQDQPQLSALQEMKSKFQESHDRLLALQESTKLRFADSQAQLNIMKTANQKPGTISFTLAEAIFEAIVFPLRRNSSGVILMPSASQAYPAPIRLHEIVIKQSRTLTLPRSLGMRIRQTIRSMIMQAMLFPGIALAFLLLPISRQIAKVRWSHIIRVLLYSLFLPVTLCWMLVILFTAGTFIAPLESVFYKLGAGLFNYGIWITLLAWWAFATKHYLKMPHGWMIAIMFALLIAMLTASVLFLFAPTLMIDV